MTATTASSTSIGIITASQKKLCKSPYFDDSKDSDSGSSDSDTESYESYEGKGMRLFEVAGLQAALQSVCCKECGGGPVVLREDFSTPLLWACVAPSVGTSKVLEVNRKAVFAKQVFRRYLFESSNAGHHHCQGMCMPSMPEGRGKVWTTNIRRCYVRMWSFRCAF